MAKRVHKSNVITARVESPHDSADLQDCSSYDGDEQSRNVKEIAPHGDLVLRIQLHNGPIRAKHSFRVDSTILKKTSKYFERLLQPGRFGEALEVEAKHKALFERYGSTVDVPAAELPFLDMQDIGRTSSVRAVDALVADFLLILHGGDVQGPPPVVNLANIAIVADRFDALHIVKNYVQSRDLIRILDRRTTSKTEVALDEDKMRQRLLVAILLDYPTWFEKYSARLITKGWTGRELSLAGALWWDLPLRVEEELAYRRDCILETIQSVQQHFLGLYTSRERQCKLGYDNSGQCDSFQLGEMVRFFTRVGTLQFQGAISVADEPAAPYAGDLRHLLHSLKQVPEYQIDRFHTHCGIRTRITPLLELLQEGLQYTEICSVCWQTDRQRYAWIEAIRPSLWRRQDARLSNERHGNAHDQIRTMFTALEKDWS